MKKTENKKEDGMVMLEAVLYYPVVILVFAVLICVTLFFTQRYFIGAIVMQKLDDRALHAMEVDNGINTIDLSATEQEIIQGINEMSLLKGDIGFDSVWVWRGINQEIHLTMSYKLEMPFVTQLFWRVGGGRMFCFVESYNRTVVDFRQGIDCAQTVKGLVGEDDFLAQKYGVSFWDYMWEE